MSADKGDLRSLGVRAEGSSLVERVRLLADQARNNAAIVFAEGVTEDERELALMVMRAEAEAARLRLGYGTEAYILMVQALDVKALPKGRRRILTEQAIRMAKVCLSQGQLRPEARDAKRSATDVLNDLEAPS